MVRPGVEGEGVTIVATQFEYIMWCTDCHNYLTPGDDHHCVKKEFVMKRKRLGLWREEAKAGLTPERIAKLERERERLLDGVRENQQKVKEIDRILVTHAVRPSKT